MVRRMVGGGYGRRRMVRNDGVLKGRACICSDRAWRGGRFLVDVEAYGVVVRWRDDEA